VKSNRTKNGKKEKPMEKRKKIKDTVNLFNNAIFSHFEGNNVFYAHATTFAAEGIEKATNKSKTFLGCNRQMPFWKFS